MLAASPSLLALRTGQGAYGEQPPSSFHIYLWTIGANLTPMQVAARFSQHEVLDVMRRFATPTQRLLLACNQGDRDGALAIVRDHPGIVENLGGQDRRALTDEAWMANAKAVALMLELGFDPAEPAVTGPTGGTALHCAAWEGSVECIEALLRYESGRALLNVREPTHNGTPLDWCRHGALHCGNTQANHAEVERLLVAAMT
jgi:ankyrin repeat protein